MSKCLVATFSFLMLASLALAAPQPQQQQQAVNGAPAHLALAQRMIKEIKSENNSYKNGPATVEWAGIDGQNLTQNHSDCTTYVTALLKTTYHLSHDEYEERMGKSSPSISRYYENAVNNVWLRGFKEIKQLAPGDLLISKYANPTGAAGHMMMVEEAPKLVKTEGKQKVYDVQIIDCTEAIHGHDSRSKNAQDDGKADTGIGRGTMRVFVDAEGNLVTWAWGLTGVAYDPASRPITFARVPAGGK